MKKILPFIFMGLMIVCYSGCGDDKKTNRVKHDTEIIVTERFQDYETLGYYVAKNITGNPDQVLFLTAEVKDLITGETVENPKLIWRCFGGSAGVGEFQPDTGTFVLYEPLLDSAPKTVDAYVYYDGDSRYLASRTNFDIKQNY